MNILEWPLDDKNSDTLREVSSQSSGRFTVAPMLAVIASLIARALSR